MKKFRSILAVLAFLIVGFFASTASAQTAPPASCSGGVCVANSDMVVMLEALKEKKCLLGSAPVVTSDAVTIVEDKEGRVYGSGSDPHPFTLHINWCTYQLSAAGQINLVAAKAPPETVGFHFKPKATLGLLGTELVVTGSIPQSFDAGLLVDPFFFLTDFNLNLFVGFRSVGGGVGMDITKNFGGYLGYSVTWGGWRSNPMASLYFSFW